jgi:hypothetical protein
MSAALEVGEVLQDLGLSATRGQLTEDGAHRDPQAPDTGQPAHLGVIDGDPLECHDHTSDDHHKPTRPRAGELGVTELPRALITLPLCSALTPEHGASTWTSQHDRQEIAPPLTSIGNDGGTSHRP